MPYSSNAQLPPKLNHWITARKLKIELLLVVLSVVSVLAFYSHISGGAEMVNITMSLLAIFYFLSAYTTPDLEGTLGSFASKIFSISSAVCVIGFMFTILKFEGADQMMLIGGSSLAIVAIIFIGLSIYNAGVDKVIPMLIRIVAMGVAYAMLKFEMFA